MLEDNHENAQLMAFNELYVKYRKALFIYAFRYIKDEEVCYELVHDAFIYLWQKRSSAIKDQNINAYLYSFVKSRSLNYLRDQRSKKLDELLASQEFTEHPDYELEGPSDTAVILSEAISSIPSPATRHIFEMRFIHEMSYKDIALSKSISINTVYVHINAALKILRNKFRKI